MVAFNITAFAGANPKTAKTLLENNQAQEAINTKLTSGELGSWKMPAVLNPAVTFSSAPKTVYGALKNDGSITWMRWSTDVDVVRGPVVGTEDYRLYYTGDGYPKKTNNALAETGSGAYPRDYLSMGVSAPQAAPTVTVSGGSGTAESRAYLYTYVSEFGDVVEESAPSAASSIVSVLPGSTVSITGFTWSGTYSQSGTTITVTETAHGLSTGMRVKLDFTSGSALDGWYDVTVTNANTYTVTSTASASTSGNVTVQVKAVAGRYNITKRRIYRAVTGTTVTTYLLVAEITVATTSYTDSVAAASLGEPLPSLNWDMPPTDLKGVVLMPNGFGAGFRANEVYFSEPYQPHAWPADYALTFDYDVVGLGVIGQTLVVLTKGYPYLVSGTDPSAMSSERLPLLEPCVSKRSIASDELGVMYASPNGVVLVQQGTAQVVTKNILTKEAWNWYNPSTMHGDILDGRYYLFYDDGDDVFGGVILDRYNPNAPFSITNVRSSATFVSPTESRLYVAIGTELKVWDEDPLYSLPFEWKSKLYITPRPINLGAIQVEADFDSVRAQEEYDALVADVKADNQALWTSVSGVLDGAFNNKVLNLYVLNGSLLTPIPQDFNTEFVQVQVWANDQLRYTAVILDEQPMRLPSGYKADRWEFVISGNIPLRAVKLAETIRELKSI